MSVGVLCLIAQIELLYVKRHDTINGKPVSRETPFPYLLTS